MKRPIFAIIGPSGCGKSTVIAALVRRFPESLTVLKSVTTRPLTRGAEDAINYDRVEPAEFERMEDADDLIQAVTYGGHRYGNHRAYTDGVLETSFGITALVESGVENFRRNGYEVYAVMLVPVGGRRRRGEARRTDDDARAGCGFVPNATIENRFDGKNGLHECVETLTVIVGGFMEGFLLRG